MILSLLLGGVVVSLLLTGMLHRYALVRSLLDIPNARSSHKVPTPRGGGVAIVLTFLLGLPALVWADAMASREMLALFGSGALVALVGFLDDHGHIAARWRLLAHFLAALWALAWIGGLPPLPVFGFLLNAGWVGQVFAAIYLVWLLNLYNFMDGIDGIASVEAITVCLGGALLYWLAAPVVTAWGGRSCCSPPWPAFCAGISRRRGFLWGMREAGFLG